MHFIKKVFTVATVLSGMAAAMPVAQADTPADHSVHCSTGTCTNKDLEAISKAIELAATDPDSVSWSVSYKVNDEAVTGDANTALAVDPSLVSNCAAGKCSQEDLDALKKAYETAKGQDLNAAGLFGSLDFTYGFKYSLANMSAPAI